MLTISYFFVQFVSTYVTSYGVNMEAVKEHGILAIATRLKLLSDKLYGYVDHIFSEKGYQFQARWYLYLSTIARHGEIGIMDLARMMGQSHPAVVQLNKKMLKNEIIQIIPDPDDDRKKNISLTDKGQVLYDELKLFAPIIEKSLNKIDLDYELKIMKTIETLEIALAEVNITKDVLRRMDDRITKKVEIITYDPKYRSDFKRLNIEWLEKYFYVEEIDDTVLSDPEKYILYPGGQIFFAKIHNEIVGTCALIKSDDDFWELSKMAVTEGYQGLKIGEKLAVRVIDEFESFNIGTLYLESNSKLIPAIRLYEKLGFRHLKKKDDSHYQRANVYMVYFNED